MKIFKQKGFSLIEVLISIAIVSLISIVVLTLFNIGNGSVIMSKQRSEELFKLQGQIEKDELSEPDTQGLILLVDGKEYLINLNVYHVSGETGLELLYFQYDSHMEE